MSELVDQVAELEPEQLFGRDRIELELELDETVATLRELHALTRSVLGANAILERRALRALRFGEGLRRDLERLEPDGRRRGTLVAGDRMRAARRS